VYGSVVKHTKESSHNRAVVINQLGTQTLDVSTESADGTPMVGSLFIRIVAVSKSIYHLLINERF